MTNTEVSVRRAPIIEKLRAPKIFLPISISIFISYSATFVWIENASPSNGYLAIGAFEFLKLPMYLLLVSGGWFFYKKERVIGWLLIAIGGVVWVPGQFMIATWTFTKKNPYISGIEVETFLLISTIFAVAGVIAVGFHGLGKREKLRASLNALSFGACMTFMAIVVLSGSEVNGNKVNLDKDLLNVGYFAIDVMLISFPLAVFLYRRMDRQTVWLSLGMIFLAVSDISYLLTYFKDIPYNPGYSRLIQLPGLIAWVYAAIRSSGKPVKQPTVRGENYLTIGVNSVVFLTIIFAGFTLTTREVIPQSVSFSFLSVFVIVLIAQLVGHFENKRLQKIQAQSIESISKSEERYQELATHDTLTNLNNRTFFVESLKRELTLSSETNQQVAILFVDLDRFKEINDTYGHNIGDNVIRELAERIQSVVAEAGLVCRLGGDEFAVLIPSGAKRDETYDIALGILEICTNPIDVNGTESYLSCSIGIAFSQENENDPQSILRNADAAMYRAKELGRNRIEYSEDVVKPAIAKTGWTLSDLHRAIVDEQIHVHYQPIYNLSTNSITAFEALARWTHPLKGAISPDEFISVAEDNGLIIEIGNAVISQSLKQLSIWQSSSPALLMNINLSFRQLNDPHLIEFIKHQCHTNSVDPSSVVFEMTESSLLGDVRNAIATLNEIQSHGFNLHIDDFGTGYSSLSYLKKFPITGFKIDKSYIQGFGHDEDDTAIVNALVSLGRAMDLQVTAEGVNSKLTRDVLLELGCTFGQGYFYSEAVPPEEIVLPKTIASDGSDDSSLKTA